MSLRYTCMQVGPLCVCCYLVWDDESHGCALIDPGGNVKTLKAVLEQNGLELRHIFLTHLHYDHIGAVDALRGENVCVWCCREELAYDEMSGGLMDITKPISFYEEGSMVEMDSLRFEVLHTPGHSAGSVCLRCESLLFTGDTLFAGSCGRTDLPGGDSAALRRSLRRLALLEGDATVLSGHSAPTTLEHERQHNPYLREAMA